MKAINLILLLIMVFSQVAVAGQQKLYTSKGYPYNHLINKADEVRIIYIEQDTEVKCRVEVSWQQSEWKSKQHSVNKQQFDQTPLASCLPRKVAKQFLTEIYAST